MIYETDKNLTELGKYHHFNSIISNVNYKMDVTLAAEYSLECFKRIVAPEESFETFTELAEQSPVGSRGINFLPYLFEERNPYFDPTLSESLIGLRAYHNRDDIVRSIMKGIVFSLKNVYENMDDKQSKSIETFRITGGITKNPFWLQLFADVFQIEIELLNFGKGPPSIWCNVPCNSWEK